VLLNKVAGKQTVGIEKNQIGSPGLEDRLIENSALPKTLVLLPQVANLKTGPVPGQPLAHLRAGTVIGNDHFEIAKSLPFQRQKAQLQIIQKIIGRNDNAYGWPFFHQAFVLSALNNGGGPSPEHMSAPADDAGTSSAQVNPRHTSLFHGRWWL